MPPVCCDAADPALRRWRRRQLVAAGLDELSAQRLAADPAADLHARLSQIEQGPQR